MFPLCRTCAKNNDVERSISGCWVSIELVKAIEKGYVVARIDEVWHFPQSSDTLFSDNVKTFLEYKQEASSYPEHAVSEVDKRAYIDEYFEEENIRLNQARRSINKLLLNSLWGRFSMRENLPTTEMLKDPEQFDSVASCTWI